MNRAFRFCILTFTNCRFLLLFEALSGMRINLEKSLIIPLGDVEDLEIPAQELGCN